PGPEGDAGPGPGIVFAALSASSFMSDHPVNRRLDKADLFDGHVVLGLAVTDAEGRHAPRPWYDLATAVSLTNSWRAERRDREQLQAHNDWLTGQLAMALQRIAALEQQVEALTLGKRK